MRHGTNESLRRSGTKRTVTTKPAVARSSPPQSCEIRARTWTNPNITRSSSVMRGRGACVTRACTRALSKGATMQRVLRAGGAQLPARPRARGQRQGPRRARRGDVRVLADRPSLLQGHSLQQVNECQGELSSCGHGSRTLRVALCARRATRSEGGTDIAKQDSFTVLK